MINKTALLGAAFLMATSAIGPGFLTQTATFTGSLLASFGFVILVSIILDIGAQLNIWRIIGISGKRGTEVANMVLPNLGYFVAFLIALGGFFFNIGNIAGAGLGLNIVLGISVENAAVISAIIAIGIFIFKKAGELMDKFIVLAGFVMIVLTAYVAFASKPPIGEALFRTFIPTQIDVISIVTLVGGTVGGYIVFSGAHRLIDAKLYGKENLNYINKAAVSGIIITGIMRVILFLAVLGVVSSGFILDKENPAGSVFHHALGDLGLKIFGVVLFLAAISSVIGAAYTSISFIRSFHPWIEKYNRFVVIFFIIVSTLVFYILGKSPASILIIVGTINGWILPVTLFIMIIAAHKKSVVGDYKHPKWMSAFGLLIVALMSYLSVLSMIKLM
ncbi:divalent metal cation transporter [Campylobacter coli]|nr:divalent metal cation transporter [Campylobacter coli]EAI7937990.1 divalent metal cation transporter [Campylobacter coli]EAI7938354.1 divalent metal cation transporter [Campylobacter coli]EAI8089888.1 divalent metal cation transporter [Campylobacter coli]EAI8093887.1 divalent metal cation transporter [Campylobacter coli]